MKLVIVLSLFFNVFISCSDSNKTSNPNTFRNNDKELFHSKQTDFSSSTGISTNPNILVQDGNIIVKLENGNFTTNSGNSVSIVSGNQIQGTFLLKDIVTGRDINGVTVAGLDQVVFTPDKPLNPNFVYQSVFRELTSKNEYKENIFISVANVCNPESYFSKVPTQKSTSGSKEHFNFVVKDTVFHDPNLGPVAVIGWDHFVSKSFYFKILNRTSGAKYKVVGNLGTYNIPGHECELYHQRDFASPFPTWTDNNYGAKVTKITEEDTILHNPISKEFYNFSKTYLLIKVFDTSNVDITTADTGILSLEQTDSLYGLPLRLEQEEDSSLLAYLNRGNNNSYSMVLGGLILGIFAFFLSRRLLKSEEED